MLFIGHMTYKLWKLYYMFKLYYKYVNSDKDIAVFVLSNNVLNFNMLDKY